MSNSTAIVRVLCGLLALEACLAVFLVIRQMRQPLPPDPALAHLHPATQRELRSRREEVVSSADAAAWRGLGEAYLTFGMLIESEYCLGQAARGDLVTDRTMYLWGLALHQQGKMTAAIEKFEQAARLTGSTKDSRLDVSTCWYAIGRNRLRLDEISQAEEAFRNAGEFPPAKHQLIRILIRSGRLSEAIALLDPLIARHPIAAKLYQLRAEARAALGDTRGAAADRERAERSIEFLPADFIVQELHQKMDQFGLPRELADCRLQLEDGQLEDAALRLRALLAARWQPQVAGMLAECELRLRRGDAAITLVNRLMETEGVSARLLNIKARGLLMAGDQSQAVETWKRSADIQPTIEAHGWLAEHFLKTGDASLEKHHRSHWLLARGVAAYRRDELADAAANLNSAVAADDQLDQGWYYLGLCHLAGGSPERATEVFTRCLTVNPNHGRALRIMATLQAARAGS